MYLPSYFHPCQLPYGKLSLPRRPRTEPRKKSARHDKVSLLPTLKPVVQMNIYLAHIESRELSILKKLVCLFPESRSHKPLLNSAI